MVRDWNGALPDDFELTARIAGRTLASMGVPGGREAVTAVRARSGLVTTGSTPRQAPEETGAPVWQRSAVQLPSRVSVTVFRARRP